MGEHPSCHSPPLRGRCPAGQRGVRHPSGMPARKNRSGATEIERLSLVILKLDLRIHVFRSLEDWVVDPRLKGEDDGFSVTSTSRGRKPAYLLSQSTQKKSHWRILLWCPEGRTAFGRTLTTRRRRACGRGRRRRACIWGRGGRRGCRISAPCRVRRGAHRPVPGWPRIPPGCHPAQWRG